MAKVLAVVPAERIERRIIFLRRMKVMLSTDLASLYEVEHRTLVQAVKRNIDRFPEDFMFQISKEEMANLNAIKFFSKEADFSDEGSPKEESSQRGKHLKYLPYAFTEQGVAMLSSVLRSKRAIQVNIEIMRTFVNLKRSIASYEEIAQKIEALEKKYDSHFKIVFEAIRQLMAPPKPKKNRVGFHWEIKETRAGKKVPAKKKAAPKRKAPAKVKK